MNKILPISLVIIIAIISVIFWNKKINPEVTWIYSIYVVTIITLYLSAVIVLLQ